MIGGSKIIQSAESFFELLVLFCYLALSLICNAIVFLVITVLCL